jgi:hypothetical protein
VLKSKKIIWALIPFGWVFTQSAVFFAWIFFRNPDLSKAVDILSSILNRTSGTFEISDALLVLSALVASFSLDLSEKVLAPMYQKRSQITKGLVIGTLLFVSLVLKSSTVVPFIYFRF